MIRRWIAWMFVVGSQLAPGAQMFAQTFSLEDATRLTWSVETRADGVAALRKFVAGDPDNVNARFELARVLTWDVNTRPEGIKLLRTVLDEQPVRPDVEEALGEVLSWDPDTRDEAIRRLRDLQEREPTRISTRLKLADVLAWSPATRDESRELYAGVLRDDNESVEAAVGLARVLSWSGRIPESRAWYELALVRNPDAQGARVGIAELESWKGRAYASLSMLTAPSGDAIATPDALRLRGQAYSQIGRPARALEQYEKLLAVDPGNAAATDAARRLRQRVRPLLEIGAEASTESGDPDNKVETGSLPFRFAFHPGRHDTEISVTWAEAAYRNSRGTRQDRVFGAGVNTAIGNKVALSGDVITHAIDGIERDYTARGELQIAFHDGFDVRVGVAREQLNSSRLSLAGEFVDGRFYGPSFVNQATLAAGARARGWDVWAHGTAGEIRGINITNNARRELFAGGGRTFRPGGVTLRPGYSLAWMSYDLDLGAFPGEFSGDGTTAPGIGGYFSPSHFVNHMARLDVTLPIGESAVIVGGAGVGRQRVEDAWSRGTAAPWIESSDAVVGFRARLGGRVSFGAQATYQNVAAAFDRTAVRVTLGYGF